MIAVVILRLGVLQQPELYLETYARDVFKDLYKDNTSQGRSVTRLYHAYRVDYS